MFLLVSLQSNIYNTCLGSGLGWSGNSSPDLPSGRPVGVRSSSHRRRLANVVGRLAGPAANSNAVGEICCQCCWATPPAAAAGLGGGDRGHTGLSSPPPRASSGGGWAGDDPPEAGSLDEDRSLFHRPARCGPLRYLAPRAR